MNIHDYQQGYADGKTVLTQLYPEVQVYKMLAEARLAYADVLQIEINGCLNFAQLERVIYEHRAAAQKAVEDLK